MRLMQMAMAAAVVVLLSASAPAVVINEFYYGTEPPGDNEWVELYNRSGSDLDLGGWQIVVSNNGPWQVVHTITTGRDTGTTIPVDSYHLITGGADLGNQDENSSDLNLGRTSPAVVFGIALLDDLGTTIDTVLYSPAGATNTYNLKDDTGATDVARTRFVTGDSAYSRNDTTHEDTDNSSVDFSPAGPGTPVPVEVIRFDLH